MVIVIFAIRLVESAVCISHFVFIKFVLGVGIEAGIETSSSPILTCRSHQLIISLCFYIINIPICLKLILVSIYWLNCATFILADKFRLSIISKVTIEARLLLGWFVHICHFNCDLLLGSCSVMTTVKIIIYSVVNVIISCSWVSLIISSFKCSNFMVVFKWHPSFILLLTATVDRSRVLMLMRWLWRFVSNRVDSWFRWLTWWLVALYLGTMLLPCCRRRLLTCNVIYAIPYIF